MRYVELSELDDELKRVNERAKISDDELRRALSEFCLKIDYTLPNNPLSEEYYKIQMDLYSKISGRRNYSVSNECSDFVDVNNYLNNPFPYYTESPTTVGDTLMGIGFLIRTMALPPKSNIIEFGAGCGETTYHLAMMGHNVTVVDVEKKYLDIIAAKLNKYNRSANLIQEDMLKYRSSSKYDAVLFYESFHHCSNPFSFLENLYEMIYDTGIVCFAAEPIVKGYTDFIPYPWGVRLDGMSVWSMREFGWLELGFEHSFFVKILEQLGFSTEEYSSNICPLCNVLIARKNKQKKGLLKNLGVNLRTLINHP